MNIFWWSALAGIISSLIVFIGPLIKKSTLIFKNIVLSISRSSVKVIDKKKEIYTKLLDKIKCAVGEIHSMIQIKEKHNIIDMKQIKKAYQLLKEANNYNEGDFLISTDIKELSSVVIEKLKETLKLFRKEKIELAKKSLNQALDKLKKVEKQIRKELNL